MIVRRVLGFSSSIDEHFDELRAIDVVVTRILGFSSSIEFEELRAVELLEFEEVKESWLGIGRATELVFGEPMLGCVGKDTETIADYDKTKAGRCWMLEWQKGSETAYYKINQITSDNYRSETVKIAYGPLSLSQQIQGYHFGRPSLGTRKTHRVSHYPMTIILENASHRRFLCKRIHCYVRTSC